MKINGVGNIIFSAVGGYISSVALANLLGCKLSLIGPFMGVLSLTGSAIVIGMIAIPVIIGGVIIYQMAR